MARKRVETKPKNSSSSIRPVIFMIAGVMLVIVAILLFINQSNPTQSSTITDVSQVQRISLENARKALTENSAVFLDVRSADSFKVNHISGAINIPLDGLENRYTELDPNQWIITYCTWPAEESSARAAIILLNKGFTRVEAILGGFAAWQQAGYPTQAENK